MPANNPKANTSRKPLLPAARYTATGNGTGIDTIGFNSALILLDFGNGGGTTPTLDVKIQESDTLGGTYTDITGAVFAQITGSGGGDKAGELYLQPRKRFIRAVRTISGTSPTFDGGVWAVLMNPEDTAVAADAYAFQVLS